MRKRSGWQDCKNVPHSLHLIVHLGKQHIPACAYLNMLKVYITLDQWYVVCSQEHHENQYIARHVTYHFLSPMLLCSVW